MERKENEVLKLLRLGHEPRIHFSEIEIHNILMEHTIEIFEYITNFYFQWSKDLINVQNPLKQLFQHEGLKGDFRVMPCVVDDYSGLPSKIIKIIGTNEENRYVKDKISVGMAMKLNSYDNYVETTFDVCSLSSYRTALISVLATYFWNDQFQKNKIGVIGTGRIGFYTTYILNKCFNIRNFIVNDSSASSFGNYQMLCEKYLTNVNLEFAPVGEVLSCSEVLYLATTSVEPIVEKSHENIQFISSVGADADNLSELHFDAISDYQLLVDYYQSSHIGDLKRWKNDNLISDHQIVDLKDLINNHMLTNQKTLFVSTGIAVQDAIIIDFIIGKAKS